MCVGLKNGVSFGPNKGEKMSQKDICVKQPFMWPLNHVQKMNTCEGENAFMFILWFQIT
jgi:hypothetical protein